MSFSTPWKTLEFQHRRNPIIWFRLKGKIKNTVPTHISDISSSDTYPNSAILFVIHWCSTFSQKLDAKKVFIFYYFWKTVLCRTKSHSQSYSVLQTVMHAGVHQFTWRISKILKMTFLRKFSNYSKCHYTFLNADVQFVTPHWW